MGLVFPANSPPTLQSDNGVIATIEILANGDQSWIVVPMATDNAGNIPHDQLCQHALATIEANILQDILACMGSAASVTRVQVESMCKGTNIPAEDKFLTSAHPGTLGTAVMPSIIGVLFDWYVDPSQVLAGGRQRVGKNILPGISTAQVVGDVVQTTLRTAVETFLVNFMDGYGDASGGASKWYRVGKAVRLQGNLLPNVLAGTCREYLGTQRRRQIPH